MFAVSALFDGATWLIALRSLKRTLRYSELFGEIHLSKDPPSFMVLFEDGAALIGLSIAVLGTWVSVHWGMPILDGVASILIGLLLAGTATLLARETKGLLMGEPADPRIVASIQVLAAEMEGVAHANGILTVHLGPQQIVVALSLEFAGELKTPVIEEKVTELELRLRHAHPAVIAVFVRPQSSIGYDAAMAARYGTPPRVVIRDDEF